MINMFFFYFQLASNTKKLWDDNEAARAAPEAGGAKPAFLAGHGNPWTPREDTWGAAPSGGECIAIQPFRIPNYDCVPSCS